MWITHQDDEVRIVSDELFARAQRVETMPQEIAALDARLERLRERLKNGDLDMMPDELQATIERVEAKRHELTAAATRAVTGDGARIFSLLPKAAEYHGEQIALGLDGDPQAAAKARPLVRKLLGGKVELVPGEGGSLWADTACRCSPFCRLQEHLVGVKRYTMFLHVGKSGDGTSASLRPSSCQEALVKRANSPLEYYAEAGPMTIGGPHAGYLESASSDIRELATTVQQLFLYDVVAKDFYGFDVPKQRADEIHLRSTEALLDRIIQLDDALLAQPRSLDKRTIGRCHHFALMTVAVLRAHGISARARCGFGAYFNPPQFEDHWVCEYWDAGERRWVLADTQFDVVWIEKLEVKHDVLDVPRDRFLTAADAWKQCRTGKLDPARFGISFVQLHGLWFVAGSLVRDLASVNKMEMLPWDSWGAQPGPEAKLDDSQLRFFDEIAAMTCDVDTSFDAAREMYAKDDRLRVPHKVFNGLKKRMESVEFSFRHPR